MDKLQLPFLTMIYRFPYGNHLGVAAFMWKIPDDTAIDQTQVSRLVSKLNERQQFFATRDMRKDFIDRYSQHVSVPKSVVLRNIYRSSTDDASSSVSERQGEVDKRVEEALATDDPEILLDLRKQKLDVHSSKYDAFWVTLKKSILLLMIDDIPMFYTCLLLFHFAI